MLIEKRIHVNESRDKNKSKEFISGFVKCLTDMMIAKEKFSVVFVCIGTDRSTGDSLGPLIGTFVQKFIGEFSFIYCYGTLEDPIHAMNFTTEMEKIQKRHSNAIFVGIDASLGHQENIGTIFFCNMPIDPGAGVNKQLSPVGDMSIRATVNVSGYMEYFVLQNTRFALIYNLAEAISNIIHETCRELHKSKEIYKSISDAACTI
jgi:putative sporulation protein YyaC